MKVKSNRKKVTAKKPEHFGSRTQIMSEIQKLKQTSLLPGSDYQFESSSNKRLVAVLSAEGKPIGAIGGFHVDLGGKIIENSIWYDGFRPACPDPRGMALVSDTAGKPLFWADIYLMDREGRSRAGMEPADGYEKTPTGFDKLRQADAIELLARHGKQLLNREEFALATDGVKEGKATGTKPTKTERVEGLTSRFGLEQATGALWVWSREKDNDGWPYVMGGSWNRAGSAGPRRVSSGHPVSSSVNVGARGRCDHLSPGPQRSESVAAHITAGLSFEDLRVRNVARCQDVFHPIDDWSPSDWACALAGEAGETCNSVKKLRRLDDGTNTAKDPQTKEAAVAYIAKELADTVIYADLLAARLGINLAKAVRDKFNEVSNRMKSNIKL